ncbi:MAG: glycoside hydrolase family 1 protein [Candidatus Omnitrophica bacterium]|nr:glycoside hydrolase family 1 protein [Candidatus Omnitrophota bacterium]MBU1128666.1 glycoside hydrolase family 1 protein [Candidatus Omnitrophota bacterium]MBU1784905.1 glycoside hydrolase family 1 protein [Candidatus Omnitrophota bacterium]MBU1852204.1 glycoside hydrolase family 1 protein [Candidatus Omnitrophota bacterium]
MRTQTHAPCTLAIHPTIAYNCVVNKFPDNFMWGASTSSHQVEGNNFYNDWWKWEQAGNTDPSLAACDHYNKFREDFAIAKELGHNAHRFSLEWSRLERAEGSWDQKAWDHYREVLDELIRLGIEPVVSLNHFTLPSWLAQKGGWKNADIIPAFERFAEKAARELGNRVKYWITINEPMVLAFIGYFKGDWPPCEKSFASMLYVTGNMLKAHAAAYVTMKKTANHCRGVKAPKIGIAKSVATFHPCSRYSILDRMAAFLRANFQNHAFIRSAITGRAGFFPYLYDKLPAKNTLDFIGLNYYFREFVHHKNPVFRNPFGYICSQLHHKSAGKRTTMGWEIYPEGLYEVVKSFSRYKLPIIIAENGLSTYDDSLRREYLKGHLSRLLRAIDEKIPVIGYLHWSLLDNFEWAEGYTPRFGLVEVDYETQKRAIKDSARYYAEIIRSGKIINEQNAIEPSAVSFRPSAKKR